MRSARFALTLVFCFLPVIFISCSIEEASTEIIVVDDELAVLNVTAKDADTNADIDGAELLFIQGDTVHFYETPYSITNLAEGTYELQVHPAGTYAPGIQVIDLAENDTMDIELLAGMPQGNAATEALYTINSDITDAQIIVNNKFIDGATTNSDIYLLPVNDTYTYSISVYKEAHRTIFPAGIIPLPTAGSTNTLDFELVPMTTSSTVGDLIPDVTLPDPDGVEYSTGQYRGHVLLVNFWFYTCVPCRAEFPAIQEVYEERYEDGFRILAMNTGWASDTPEMVAEFEDLFGLKFPLLRNTIDTELTVDLFNLQDTAPINILVDEEGVIQYRVGAIEKEDLNEYIDHILAD